MKKAKKALIGLLLLSGVAAAVPAPASAGSSTDAALALGAFAVFNQILGGTGIFGGVIPRPVPAPVVVQPYPAVVYPPPPPVVYAPRPSVVYAPAPYVVYAPPPVAVYPRHWTPRRAYYGTYGSPGRYGSYGQHNGQHRN